MSDSTQLPIARYLPEILQAVQGASSFVLKASPGAGKTTQVPFALLKSLKGRQEIWVLEPRRLAAKFAAHRVAFEAGEEVGKTVGYQFRFESRVSEQTRLRFLTEGMLMRKILSDPKLGTVGIVVLDEFHERHIHTDVALSYLRYLQQTARPDLKILVMSATLDTESLSAYLGGSAAIEVEGRSYPVTVEYLDKPSDRYLEILVKDAVRSALAAPEKGDILIFLPGMAEILRSQDALKALLDPREWEILVLHGDLSREEQDRAMRRSKIRKVILSTNVAESSVTIEGVTIVIDSGLARVASHSAWTGLPALKTQSISRASAIQRAGRAGRTAPGRCYRLYTRGEFDGRAAYDLPEIRRADLSQTVLELKALGIQSLREFPWFDRPSDAALSAAEDLLLRLGAIEEATAITELGRKLVELPLHPRLGRVLLELESKGHSRLGALCVSVLSEARLDSGGDFYHSLRKWERDPSVVRVMERLKGRSRGGATSPPRPKAISGQKAPTGTDDEETALRYALMRGFPDRIAKRRSASDSVAKEAELVFSSGGAAMVENSPLINSSEFFVVLDADERKSQRQQRSGVWVRVVSPIEPDWLLDLEPGVSEEEELTWNPRRKRVESRSKLSYGQLVLSEEAGKPHDRQRAIQLLLKNVLEGSEGFRSGILRFFGEAQAELGNLLERWDYLAKERVDLELPELPDEKLRSLITEWTSEAVSESDLKAIDLHGMLVASLSEQQRQGLERLAPERVQLAQGRRVKVHYEPGKPPWIESRLQDFFGMTEGPRILGGKVALTLHLLAPNQRAVQVTNDLAGFWKRIYPELRRELGRRYPRHAWPEDPLKPGSAKKA